MSRSNKWTVAEGVWLDNVVERFSDVPTFVIPSETERKSLSKYDWEKLVFHFPDKGSERMWVEVIGTIWKNDELTYIGKLKSDPFHDELEAGAAIHFQPAHVCAKDRPPRGWKKG